MNSVTNFSAVSTNIIDDPTNLSDPLYLSASLDWSSPDLFLSLNSPLVYKQHPYLNNPFVVAEFRKSIATRLKKTFPFLLALWNILI